MVVCVRTCVCMQPIIVLFWVWEWTEFYSLGTSSLSFKLKIKRNDWLRVGMCPQVANHCALFWAWEWTEFYNLGSSSLSLKLKIKLNEWLRSNTCPQAANHCALFCFEFENEPEFYNLGTSSLFLSKMIAKLNRTPTQGHNAKTWTPKGATKTILLLL